MGDGWASTLSVKLGDTIDSGATPLEFTSESLRRTETIINPQGMAGTRSQRSERSRISQAVVAGSITLPWSPASGAVLLPLILGADASGTTFALAEALQEFTCQIDRVTKVYTYTDLLVNKATWKGSAGGFVDLTMDLMGVAETEGAAGSAQALTAPLDPPYVFADCVMSFAGTSYTITDFELSVDNKLASRFGNSVTATRNSPSDLREVMFKFTSPFGTDEYAMYNTALAGVAIVLTLTNGGYSTVFTMAKVQFPDETPVVGGKGEVPITLNGIARMTSTTRELVVTHDSSA